MTDDEDGMDVGLSPCRQPRHQCAQTAGIEAHGARRGDGPAVTGRLRPLTGGSLNADWQESGAG